MVAGACSSLDQYAVTPVEPAAGQSATGEPGIGETTGAESAGPNDGTVDLPAVDDETGPGEDPADQDPADQAPTDRDGNASPAVALGDPYPVAVIARVPSELATGLTVVADWLLESTGDPGSSRRKLIDPRNGTIALAVANDSTHIAGDLATYENRVVQLIDGQTYALVVDPATLAEIDRLPLGSPAWGICHDGTMFVTSDGSGVLTIRDNQGGPIEQLPVEPAPAVAADNPVAVSGLDSLACTPDLIVATVWSTRRLLVIDRASGVVLKVVDLSDLDPTGLGADDEPESGVTAVAFNPSADRLYVTGRNWDRILVLRLIAAEPEGARPGADATTDGTVPEAAPGSDQ